MTLPAVTPVTPTRVRTPFDHADWIFELKLDGFRALAYVEDDACRLVSRRGHVYKAFTHERVAGKPRLPERHPRRSARATAKSDQARRRSGRKKE